MAKSRNFSIYLLKPGFDATNAIKSDNTLEDPIAASNLPPGSTLFITDAPPNPPWWKDYWGIQKELYQSSKGALIFLPVDERCFVLSFGHSYHNLVDESIEYDFGLKTTLNALDPEKIKSTDILTPENAKRERIQSPTASNLTFFDIKKDESIIKRLTGVVKSQYKNLLSCITGADNLRITSKYSASEIVGLCKELFILYNKEDYKTSFPDIKNIAPVKDPNIISQLDVELLNAFKIRAVELVLAVPEIIDHTTPFTISYSGSGLIENAFDDVYIDNYRSCFKDNDLSVTTSTIFKQHRMDIVDENNKKWNSPSVYKCFIFDCELKSEHYHLCDGEWFRIEKDYIQKLKKELDPIFFDHKELTESDFKREDDYNKSIPNLFKNYYCLDKKNIAPDGQTQIEPCDLLTINTAVNLIHIKISTRSSSLSHLFNQGLNSVQILRLEEQSRKKLKNLVNDTNAHQLIDESKYEVIYGIITAKNKDKKSDNLPIFSRISLMRTLNTFKVMGIKCSVVFIFDKVDRKSTEDKEDD